MKLQHLTWKKLWFVARMCAGIGVVAVVGCGKANDSSADPSSADSKGDVKSQTETPITGVRPDVEEFIQVSFPDSADKRQAARQFALPLQLLAESATTPESAQDQMDALMKATGCLDVVMGDQLDAVSNEMTARVVNTKERLMAYLSMSQKLSGGSYAYPEPPESGCSFERKEAQP